jgi:hypothetical protein
VADETEKIRMEMFQSEPVRDGNFLVPVQLPNQPPTKRESRTAMRNKIREIMRPFGPTK